MAITTNQIIYEGRSDNTYCAEPRLMTSCLIWIGHSASDQLLSSDDACCDHGEGCTDSAHATIEYKGRGERICFFDDTDIGVQIIVL